MLIRRPGIDPLEESRPLALLARELLSTSAVPGVNLSGDFGDPLAASRGSASLAGTARSLLGGFSQSAPPGIAGTPDPGRPFLDDLGDVRFSRVEVPSESDRPVGDPRANRLRAILGLASVGIGIAGALSGADTLAAAGAGAAQGFSDLQAREDQRLAGDQAAFDEEVGAARAFNAEQAKAERDHRQRLALEAKRARSEHIRRMADLAEVGRRMIAIERIQQEGLSERERIETERESRLRKESVENPTLGERASMLNARTAAERLARDKEENPENRRATLRALVELEDEIGNLQQLSGVVEPRDRIALSKQIRELQQQRDEVEALFSPAQRAEYARLRAMQASGLEVAVDENNPDRIDTPNLNRLREEALRINEIDMQRIKEMYERGEIPPDEYEAVVRLYGGG